MSDPSWDEEAREALKETLAAVRVDRVPVPPARPWYVPTGVVLGMAVAGPAAGLWLARVLAPGSILAQAVGFFSFPLVLGLGYQIWTARVMAAASRHLLSGLWRGLRHLIVRRRRPPARDVLPTRDQLESLFTLAFEAASAFGRIGWVVGVPAGLVAALAAGDGNRLAALIAFTAACGLYGRALTRLARKGYLPLPDDG